MSFESAFLDLMPSTVTIAARSGHNNYGEPSFGSGSSYRARIVRKPGFMRGSDGETIEYQAVMWIASTGDDITVSDRVTLPDSSTPVVVGVERYPDSDGAHHVKLMLGF